MTSIRVSQARFIHIGTATPGVGFDAAAGYEVGAQYFNTATNKLYACFSAAAGAAVWSEITNPAGVLDHIAAAAPTATDDNTAGFQIFSKWVDTSVSPAEAYICTDASTGAAVWENISVNADDLGSLAFCTEAKDDLTVQVTGSNNTFTLSSTPTLTQPVYVYFNGLLQRGSFYSVSGTTLTLTVTPVVGDEVIVSYKVI